MGAGGGGVAVLGLNSYARTHDIGEDASYFLIILSPTLELSQLNLTGRHFLILLSYPVLLRFHDVLLLHVLSVLSSNPRERRGAAYSPFHLGFEAKTSAGSRTHPLSREQKTCSIPIPVIYSVLPEFNSTSPTTHEVWRDGILGGWVLRCPPFSST